MNCKEANEIMITDFLYSQGIEPKKIFGNNYWYISPLRDEKTPSFKVDVSLNRWYDHGMGVGGKLVDLGIRLYQITITEFLERLKEIRPSESLSFHKQMEEPEKPVIKKIKNLENQALLDYLYERGIEIPIAQTFCSEVYFSTKGKNYFAVCFKNNLGGYEVRNKFYKGSLGTKAITTIVNGNSNSFAVFEGFLDFLSAYQLGGVLSSVSYIILNSVNQIGHAIDELNQYKPDYVLAYFDNDEAGERCLQRLKESLPNAIDRSHYYSGYKDYNEMAMASLKSMKK